jgi:hypothetical protein
LALWQKQELSKLDEHLVSVNQVFKQLGRIDGQGAVGRTAGAEEVAETDGAGVSVHLWQTVDVLVMSIVETV